jgi:hypothetical protein
MTPTEICGYMFGFQGPGYYNQDAMGEILGSDYVLSNPGIVKSLSAYFEMGGFDLEMALYDSLGGRPNRLLVATGRVMAARGWNAFPVPPTLLAPGTYFIAMNACWAPLLIDMTATSRVWMAFGAGCNATFPATLTGAWPDSHGALPFRADYCLPPGAPTPLPTSTPTWTFTRTFTFTPTITSTPTNTSTVARTPAPGCSMAWVTGYSNCPEQRTAVEESKAVQFALTPGKRYVVRILEGCITYGSMNGTLLAGTRLRLRQAQDTRATGLTSTYTTVGQGAYNGGPNYASCQQAQSIGLSAPYNPVTITASMNYLYVTTDDIYGGYCGDNGGAELVEVCELPPTPTPTSTRTPRPGCVNGWVVGYPNCPEQFTAAEESKALKFPVQPGKRYVVTILDGCITYGSMPSGILYGTRLRIRQALDDRGNGVTGSYQTVGQGAYNGGPNYASCEQAMSIGLNAPYNPVTVTASLNYLYIETDDVYGGYCGDNGGAELVEVCEIPSTPTFTPTPSPTWTSTPIPPSTPTTPPYSEPIQFSPEPEVIVLPTATATDTPAAPVPVETVEQPVPPVVREEATATWTPTPTFTPTVPAMEPIQGGPEEEVIVLSTPTSTPSVQQPEQAAPAPPPAAEPTGTPTATETPSSTATDTPSPTPTDTPTAVPTETPTPTAETVGAGQVTEIVE